MNKRIILHWVIPFLFLCMAVACGYYGWNYLKRPSTLAFHHVKVITPAKYVDPVLLQNTIRQHINGGFFALNIQGLRDSVLTIPWVANVSVRKVWPDQLEIKVDEQKPLARWDGAGIINAKGNLFFPPQDTIPASLPQLFGPYGTQNQVINMYQLLNTDLAVIGLQVKELALSARLSWTVQLSNNMIVMLGRVNMEQRFKQFVQAYPQVIGAKGDQVVHVDLRYPDGIAIKWQ